MTNVILAVTAQSITGSSSGTNIDTSPGLFGQSDSFDWLLSKWAIRLVSGPGQCFVSICHFHRGAPDSSVRSCPVDPLLSRLINYNATPVSLRDQIRGLLKFLAP